MAQLQTTGVTGSLSVTSNTGIGVVTPLARLHLSSSSTTSLRIETRAGSAADTEIEFVGPDTHSYVMGIDASDTSKFKISYNNSRTPPPLGTNDRFVINTSGNIGLGTSTPSYYLHSEGGSVSAANQPNVHAFFKADVDGRQLIRVQNSSVNPAAAAVGSGLSLQTYSNKSNQPATNTHEAQILLLPFNNSLIGQFVLIAPVDMQFNVSASNVNMSGDPGYANYGNAAMFIKRDGNVGIGNIAPAYKLDVTGTIRTTGDVGIGAANDGTARLYVQGEGLTEPFLFVQTCLGNNSTSTATYNVLKGYLAIKIGNNVGTTGNLITAGTYYLRLWGV